MLTHLPSEDALPVWRSLPPPRPGLRAVVIVPARDEAARVGAALTALAAQQGVGRAPLDASTYEMIVLANNCTDDTASIARGFARVHPGLAVHVASATLPDAQSNIGFVRRQLMDIAWQRLRDAGRATGGVIASTDSDSTVAADWLVSTFAEIDAGADAVGGRIVTDDGVVPTPAALRRIRVDAAHSLLRARLETLLDPDPADPWPRHHQHFGASLAVRADAYAAVGGLPRVPWLEDDALVRALQRKDFRVRHSPRVRVLTSSRLDGRAEVGLAWQLRRWADEARPDSVPREPQVAPADRYAALLIARAALHGRWRQRQDARTAGGPWGNGRRLDDAALARIDAALRLPPGGVAERLEEGGPFGAIWDDLLRLHDEAMHAAGEAVPVGQAIAGLRRLVAAQLGRGQPGDVKASKR